MNNLKLSNRIATLRNELGLTQNELGERLGVSFQAVSKWERGETLPDITLLPSLADILETSIDRLLRGEDTSIAFKGKIKVKDMIDGINHLKQMGDTLGKDNILYRHAVEGINQGMNTDIEAAFEDDFVFEAFVGEAILQNLQAGYYVDLSDINRHFKHDHFRNIVVERAKQYGIC